MISPPLISFSLFVLGALCASFTGVIAERIHTGQSWVSGRSRCNSCRALLDFRDLLPIVSWFVHVGRCRVCRARIPAAYAIAELILGTAFVLAYHALGLVSALPFFLVALVVLLFIVLYDLRHMVVPTNASNVLIVLGLIVAFLRAPSVKEFGLVLATAGIIALFFFLMHVLSKGRAMGLGDAPIALALSLLVGIYAFAGLLFSFWIGALYGIAVLSTRRGGPRMGIEVPFVPFLALGYLLAFFSTWNPFVFVL
ncbi:MAG: leader peptidase (prepilin peptidase) / N-methyltransferase [Parcubacteria bacterium C7867-007]|nr:MAG: leader peptidase (prepilin peptidase) / N-methyltransferase [Parcubacteria bacterium C7867-007]